MIPSDNALNPVGIHSDASVEKLAITDDNVAVFID